MWKWLRERLAGWPGVGLLAVVVAIAWLAGRGLPDGRLHVYFLDVGQGDAIFVRTPDGRQILVDGGPSPEALLNQLGEVMPFWDRSLDLVVLTHPDADHMTGLVALLERYQVTQTLDDLESDGIAATGAPSGSAPSGGMTMTEADPAQLKAAAPWLAQAARPGTRRVRASPGMRLVIGKSSFTVLSTGLTQSGPSAAGDNNDSLVLRLDYGTTSFLLTGDAEREAEAEMLRAGLPLRADILKVGHHGSSRSTSAPFLSAVKPRLAIIQVGAGNRFGHPQPDVLQRLADSRVLRTDQNGRIEVISDGEKLWLKTER
jgi:competence protein ComEC